MVDAKEQARIKRRENYLKNKERILQHNRESRARNIEKIKAYDRKRYQEGKKVKQSLESRRAWEQYKYKNDLIFRIKKTTRNRMKKVLKTKTKKSNELLGCSGEFYIRYLQSLFSPGMSESNYGFGPNKWTIDHIKPLSHFDLTNAEEVSKAFHYTNTKPMWAFENFAKSNKYVG